MTDQIGVRQLRLCVTASDYAEALRFFRDVLGLPEQASYTSPESAPGGQVTILEAGRATLELANPAYAEYIDQVEVGSRVAGHIRVAFEVDDCPTVTSALADAGAEIISAPTRTPWDSVNARLAAPAGLQVTVFAELGESTEPGR
jgi:catechol 2,3-dioxygenase-like lactoylglutathione lyase family enzyme